MESPQLSEPLLSQDNQPHPQQTKRQGGWTAFPFIIGAVMGMSVAAAGWDTNLLVYMIKEYNIKSIKATQINNVLLGCTNFFPILGAFLVDSYFTSFAVITAFSSLSLLGMSLLTLSATLPSMKPPPCPLPNFCKPPTTLQFTTLYTIISLCSLGYGATNYTIATMGADQFENPLEQDKFFNWYLSTSYAAKVIGYTAIVYIEDNVSWGLGFGICAVANAIAFGLFVSGKRFYRHVQPKGSPFLSILRVGVAAVRKRSYRDSVGLMDYNHGDRTVMPTSAFKFLNRAALKPKDTDNTNHLDTPPPSWKTCTVEEVEDLKTLINLIPIWSAGLLTSISIGTFASLSVLQALSMNTHFFTFNFQIPPASFIIFTLISGVVSTFIIEKTLIPTWHNLTRRSLSPLQRSGIGSFFVILTFIFSALIESARLGYVNSMKVKMSAMWLVLPCATFGVAQGFSFPAMVCFFYQEFPCCLKSTSTAVMSLVAGIGFYMSSVFVGLVRKWTSWLPDDIDRGRLDLVFWLLTGVVCFNFVFYLVCAIRFKYRSG